MYKDFSIIPFHSKESNKTMYQLTDSDGMDCGEYLSVSDAEKSVDEYYEYTETNSFSG